MEFRILGSLEVRENGHQVPLGGSKQRAVLASLLLHANEVVSRDRLVDELWVPHLPPPPRPRSRCTSPSCARRSAGI